MNNLMIPTGHASSVYMPDRGWFLFGGNELKTSQKITNIQSNAEEGPAVQATNIYNQCAVQVMKKMTIKISFIKKVPIIIFLI